MQNLFYVLGAKSPTLSNPFWKPYLLVKMMTLFITAGYSSLPQTVPSPIVIA